MKLRGLETLKVSLLTPDELEDLLGDQEAALDRLRAQKAELVEASRAATKSLETIATKGGRDEYLQDWSNLRLYAKARADVALAAIAKAEGKS